MFIHLFVFIYLQTKAACQEIVIILIYSSLLNENVLTACYTANRKAVLHVWYTVTRSFAVM
jgi:hypothetical protein